MLGHRVELVKDSLMERKICIVSSCGGHLTEVRTLQPAYARYEHFYVLNNRVCLPRDMTHNTYFITHSERDWRFLINLWEAWRILRRERPGLILSTGAGPCVPFALVGKVLRVPSIFIETFNRVTEPSLSGRIMYRLANVFFYQWDSLKRFYPKGTYVGPLV
jgi:UDP-N-acetylglucosamine:LPS N-acetylglucosamine transferase